MCCPCVTRQRPSAAPVPPRWVMRCVCACPKSCRPCACLWAARESVIVSESAAVESLRRHRRDASMAFMASVGLLESVGASPRRLGDVDLVYRHTSGAASSNLIVTIGPYSPSGTNRLSLRSQMATERQAKRLRLLGGMQVHQQRPSESSQAPTAAQRVVAARAVAIRIAAH